LEDVEMLTSRGDPVLGEEEDALRGNEKRRRLAFKWYLYG
jgi:hypothetical protein